MALCIITDFSYALVEDSLFRPSLSRVYDELVSLLVFVTVKPYFKVLGLYPGGLILRAIKKLSVSPRQEKTYLRNELKLTYHYILSYIYNTFTVRHNKRRMFFKIIYETDLCDCF